jgi:hypothetical protein
MAEFAASLLALAGVGVAVVKAAETLRQLSVSVKYAKKDISRFALDIEVFGNHMTLSSNALKRQLSNSAQSQLAKEFKELNLMGKMSKQSKDTKRRVERVIRKIKGFKGNYDPWTILKWALFTKNDILEIHPHMEGLKSGVTLTIQLFELEKEARKDPTPETRQRM